MNSLRTAVTKMPMAMRTFSTNPVRNMSRTCVEVKHLQKEYQVMNIMALRAFSTAVVRNMPRTREEFKRLQKEFQKDDDVPVYLKGGNVDRLLFGFLCFGIVVLGIKWAIMVYGWVYPPPNS